MINLIDHAKQTADEWMLLNLNHHAPVIHYRVGDGVPQAVTLAITVEGLSPSEVQERVGHTLQKMVLDGATELTLSYEGTWEENGDRVLVVVHYTEKKEITWVARVVISPQGRLVIGEWNSIVVNGGPIHRIFRKALSYKWN